MSQVFKNTFYKGVNNICPSLNLRLQESPGKSQASTCGASQIKKEHTLMTSSNICVASQSQNVSRENIQLLVRANGIDPEDLAPESYV